MTQRKIVVLAAALSAWIACVAISFAALQRYAGTAGPAKAPASAASKFLAAHRKAGRALIVMAVHPQCSCTDASLAELGDLLARSGGACDALLLEYAPEHPPVGWPVSVTARELGGILVPVLPDSDGKLALELGAETSGHLVFVDATGAIRFHGGLTLSRGHRGRSPAQDAILDSLAGKPMSLGEAPVYGCTIEAECKAEVKP